MKLLRKIHGSIHHPNQVKPISSTSHIVTQKPTFPFFPPTTPCLKTLCTSGQLQEALLEMAIQGLEMKFDGYDSLLNACINQRAVREGQRVHVHMIKTHYLPPVYLRTRLIVFYNKCDCLLDARKVLDEMPDRNVVSWTAMISAYSQRGFSSQALKLFAEMMKSGMLGFCFSLSLFLSVLFSWWMWGVRGLLMQIRVIEEKVYYVKLNI